jgi:restriction system protein
VELTAPTRDGGCDIIAFSVNELGIQSKYIIECKRYRPDCPVGVRLVRSLYGIKDSKQAQHAILATTSYFTRDAIAFAENPSVLGLHLKDINDISEWLKQEKDRSKGGKGNGSCD